MSLLALSTLTANVVLAAQGGEPIARSPEYWFAYASKLPIGSTVRVRTTDGQRETAILTVVDRDSITLDRTRNSAAPVRIVYAQLEQLELQKQGSGVGKAIAIGAAVGAATFFGIMLFFATAMD